MFIRLYTSDRTWAQKHARKVLDGPEPTSVAAIVYVPDSAVTPDTFAGRPMLRFDYRVIAADGSMPRDHASPHALVPAGRKVPGSIVRNWK